LKNKQHFANKSTTKSQNPVDTQASLNKISYLASNLKAERLNPGGRANKPLDP